MTSKNPNHPCKGARLWADPIRSVADIERVKAHLVGHARNHAIFTVGINTNLRASDIVKLTVGDVIDLKSGQVFMNREQKTSRYIARAANPAVVAAISRLLAEHPRRHDLKAPLFISQRNCPLTVPTLSRLVKSWCAAAGIGHGKYSSHTLRKTWAYHALRTFNVPFHLVSAALGHRDHATTLTYLGIQVEEIVAAFMHEL